MEFTRDLEVQRMQLFMQTQIEVAKMEHAKHGGTEIELLFMKILLCRRFGGRLRVGPENRCWIL
jgi:hypothetical protein